MMTSFPSPASIVTGLARVVNSALVTPLRLIGLAKFPLALTSMAVMSFASAAGLGSLPLTLTLPAETVMSMLSAAFAVTVSLPPDTVAVTDGATRSSRESIRSLWYLRRFCRNRRRRSASNLLSLIQDGNRVVCSSLRPRARGGRSERRRSVHWWSGRVWSVGRASARPVGNPFRQSKGPGTKGPGPRAGLGCEHVGDRNQGAGPGGHSARTGGFAAGVSPRSAAARPGGVAPRPRSAGRRTATRTP